MKNGPVDLVIGNLSFFFLVVQRSQNGDELTEVIQSAEPISCLFNQNVQ